MDRKFHHYGNIYQNNDLILTKYYIIPSLFISILINIICALTYKNESHEYSFHKIN